MPRPLDRARVDWFTAHTHIFGLLLLCVSAIQTFMWIYMACICSGAPSEVRKRRLPYLLVSLMILLLCSGSAILACIQSYRILLDISPDMKTMEEWIAIQLKHQDTLDRPTGLLADLAIRVGEGLLIYRCSLVWNDRRWVVVVPTLMLLVGLGINLRTYIPYGFINSNLNAVEVFLVVGLNGLLTSLISFRLIQARKRLKASLPEADHSLYLGIVGILVESAAPIVLFGTGFAVARICNATFKTRTLQLARTLGMFNLLFITSAILAPQVIIFRVATGASWASKVDTSAKLSHAIQFNHEPQPAHTTFHDEESDIKT